MKRGQLLETGLIAGDGTVVGSLRAGVAKSDITTDAKGVVVNDPLYAKALVLDDGTTKLVIIAMDVVAIGGICDIGDNFLPRLRSRIQKDFKIPGSHVLVNASHTHPAGRLLCDDDDQVDKTFDAVRRALQNMKAVKVGTGRGHEDRIIIKFFRKGQKLSIRDASNPSDVIKPKAGKYGNAINCSAFHRGSNPLSGSHLFTISREFQSIISFRFFMWLPRRSRWIVISMG